MTSPTNPLFQPEQIQIQELRARLSILWSQVRQPGRYADLNLLLPAPGVSNAATLVQELVKADMEIRAHRRVGFQLATYQTQFPRLHGLLTVTPELVYLEYRLRQALPNPPRLEEYQGAYPQFSQKLSVLARTTQSNTYATQVGEGTTAPSAPTLPPSLSGAPPRSSGSHSTGTARLTGANPGGSGTSSLSQHYQMIRVLGKGAYGEVWLAEAPGGVEVAIKKIFRSVDQEEGKRELEVLRLIKGLRHPFLLQTQAYWREEDRLFIVMDLADGSLRDRLNQAKKQGLTGVPIDDMLRYFKETAEALDFLHAQKLHHRDIKPENILLLQGHAKVADFGLTREMQGDQMAQATFCGSPVYMAPEVWNQSLSPHSDQYSLAVTYVELRLSRLPYKAASMHELMMMHIRGDPVDLQPMHDAEQAVVRRALAREPQQRYPNCATFIEELRKATQPVRSMTVIEMPPEKPPSRLPWYLVGAMVVLLGLTAALVAWHFGKDNDTTTEQAGAAWLPAGFEGVGEDIDRTVPAQPLYKTIQKREGDLAFVFVLIPGEPTSGISRFYMMRDKVSNAQFAYVAREPSFLKELKRLEDQQPEPGNGEARSGHWTELTENPQWPVRAVTVTEAHCFAHWLGGKLPTVNQWDRAGGKFEKDPGPFDPDFKPPEKMLPNNEDIAVGQRRVPLPVGTAKRDRSRFGCRDMAGNGAEWTSTLKNLRNVQVDFPLEKPERDDKVEMRGQSFTSNGPLIWETFNPKPYPYLGWLDDISFRVALEIPRP